MDDIIEMRRFLSGCQPVGRVGDSEQRRLIKLTLTEWLSPHKILMSVDQLESLQRQEVHAGPIAVPEVDLVVDEEHVGEVGQRELGSDVVALLGGENVGLVGGDGPVSVLITGQHFQTGGTNRK